MSGNRALKRALKQAPVEASTRLAGVPAITDTTELITPELAQEYLTKNRHQRPVNWKKVEEFADVMAAGRWKLHAQGIIMDPTGNILTGQTRLWGVVYSGTAVYMRVSRGSPADTATVIDRGRPQTSRDLASRVTEDKHSPLEASLARAISAARGVPRPDPDTLAAIIVVNAPRARGVLDVMKGVPKGPAMLMVVAAICEIANAQVRHQRVLRAEAFADQLTVQLLPATPKQAWGRGGLFLLAMDKARGIVA